MLRDLTPELISTLVEKNYVLFGQKTEFGLKNDYPELETDPAFAGLGKYEMRFVWAMACASSPFQVIDNDEQKIRACVHYAYPEKHQKSRTSEFLNTIPENVRRGMGRMKDYNMQGRVIEYLMMKQARDNIVSIINQDITGATAEEKKEYLDQVKVAQNIMIDQRKRIEGLNMGISEEHETLNKEAIDVLALYHHQNN